MKRKEPLKENAESRLAFTLIELIVAIVLGSLLMFASTAILRRCFSEIRVSMDQDPRLGRTGLLLDQLRRDMTNARQIVVGLNRFEIAGYIHRDPVTLISTMRPARVVYEIRKNGTQSVLVRIQDELVGSGGIISRPFVEYAYVGASSLLLSSNEIGGLVEADSLGLNSDLSTSRSRRSNSMPSSVMLLLLDQKGRTILNHTFSRQRDSS